MQSTIQKTLHWQRLIILKDSTTFSNRMMEIVQQKNVLLMSMTPNKRTTVIWNSLASVTQTY